MKEKNVIITALCVVLAGAVGAVAYLALNSNEKNVTTTSATSELTVTQTATDSSTTETITQTTTQTTTADEYAFIRSGAWYLADAENEDCIAITFKKNGDADVAYFNSDNIEGFDAQYYKGSGSYDIRKNKIIFSKFPEITGKTNCEFEIKGNDIYFSGKKLKHFDKVSLDNALKCFE